MSADEWVPFLYRDFHDVPRAVVVDLPGGRFLLECPFDHGLDEYPDEYQVVTLRGDEPLEGSWASLAAGKVSLGTVPVSPGLFDRSRRQLIRGDVVRASLELGEAT